MNKEHDNIEYEIYAVIGECLVSQLRGHDDAARVIFDAIVHQRKDIARASYSRHTFVSCLNRARSIGGFLSGQLFVIIFLVLLKRFNCVQMSPFGSFK